MFLLATYKFRMQPQNSISVELPLTNKCNFNCGRCLTFSPMAIRREYTITYDIEAFKRDVAQLAKINAGHNKIKVINLTGGEAPLNRNIEEYIKLVRQSFPHVVIRVRTNGLIIPKMRPSFWNTCKENNVEFVITEYPAQHIQNAKEIIRSHGIHVGPCGYGGDDKKMFSWPLDKSGAQKNSHKICPQANSGYVWILNGKLYNCIPTTFVRTLTKYALGQEGIKLDFQATAQDSLDIHAISSMDDITKFATKPTPFCKNCNYRDVKLGLPWMESTRKVCEWVK